MMSTSDLPACPACGARRVRSVLRYPQDGDPPGTAARTLYACAQCGSDRTDAWEAVQPPPAPEKAFDQEAKDRHADDNVEAHTLGIGATAKEPK